MPGLDFARRPSAWMFALGLCLVASVSPAAQDVGTTSIDLMARAMARMMEAMGLLDTRAPADAMNSAMDAAGVAPGPGGFGLPWMAPFDNPVRTFAMPDPGRVPADAATWLPWWRETGLDGVWEDRQGGLLIIRGSRFRIYQINAGYIDGLIQTRGQRLVLYNPDNDQARPYEFALNAGRLALRDVSGQVFLYRQLWLDADPSDDFALPRR